MAARPPNRTIRGIRESIPQGYLLGRLDKGEGPVHLISMRELQTISSSLGPAPVTYSFGDTVEVNLTLTGNVVTADLINDSIVAGRLHSTATDRVFGRTIAGAGAGAELSASDVLDMIGATQGQILYRNSTVWTVLNPGTAGQVLVTGGAGANPSWTAAATSAITFSATQRVLGRNTAGAGAGEEVTATQTLDWIYSTQGGLLLRGASVWAGLGIGATGTYLTSNGTTASWAAIDAGSLSYASTVWNELDGWLSRVTVHKNGRGLSMNTVAGTFGSIRSTTSKAAASGKWYFEAKITRVAGGGGASPLFGIGTSSATLSSFPGNDANGYSIDALGRIFNSNSVLSTNTAYADGDVIGVAVDFTASTGSIAFYLNNAANGSVTGLTLGTNFIMCGMGNSSNDPVITLNTTVAQCTYSPPSGYTNWG